MKLVASCACTSAVLLRAGAVVCATCGADVVAADAPPAMYGSRPPYPAPPGRSHRWLREHGRELEPFGATRTGGRRGRSVLWTISAEGLRAYEAAQRAATAPPTNVVHVDADAWIAGAGYRATRSA